MRYKLSKLIPVLMRSTYRENGERWSARWVQWRGRIWLHSVQPA